MSKKVVDRNSLFVTVLPLRRRWKWRTCYCYVKGEFDGEIKRRKNSGEGSSQWRICKDASFDGRETEDGKNILIFQRHAGAIIESCLRILHEYGASYSEGYIL